MMRHQLTPYLKQLRLSGILETLEVRNQQAIAEQWTYLDFLTRLLQDEVERRGQKQLDLRVRRGGIASAKTLESFDFTFNPSISRQQLYDLATCSFIHEHRNVLISTAWSSSPDREEARRLFTSAQQMLVQINAGRADGSYEKRLATYLKPQLLIIDDFGLKPLPPSGPADLYDVINARYEKASIVLTSNRAPHEWPDLFGNPLLASAGLDRLAHRAIVLLISGRSYRLARRDDGEEVSLFTQAP